MTADHEATERIDDWIVTYRLAEDETGRLVIAEIRVSPAGPLPHGGLPARLLRRIKTRGILADATTARRDDDEQEFFDRALHHERYGSHSDYFYADLARRYVAISTSGAPNPVRELTFELGDRGIDYSEATVADFIRHARCTLGLLTAAPRGRSGGELTEYAIGLLG